MTAAMTQVLRAQWLATRWLLLPLVLIGIGLPQAVVRLAALDAQRFATQSVLGSAVLLQALQAYSVVFPYLAGITGALIALATWNWDHRTGHVYALSLPISRAEYTLLKLWAGAMMLLVAAVAVWIGAWLATSSVQIPDGVRAYPFAFGARFLLAGTLLYALLFALASGTIRTTLIIVVAWTVVLIGGSIIVPWLETRYLMDLWTPTELIGLVLRTVPGPFRVFGGSWLLIDV